MQIYVLKLFARQIVVRCKNLKQNTLTFPQKLLKLEFNYHHTNYVISILIMYAVIYQDSAKIHLLRPKFDGTF